MNRIRPDNNKALTIEQSNIVTINCDDSNFNFWKVEIDLSKIKTKIEEIQELTDDQKLQYKEIINWCKNCNSNFVYKIEIQREASYNYLLKQYKVTETETIIMDTEGCSQDNIKHFKFKIYMQNTNYKSNDNSEMQRNYLKYSSSPLLILSNKKDYQIVVPLSFDLSTGISKHRKKNLVLQRSQNDVIPLNIKWKYDKENSTIKLILKASNGINNVAIKAVLYSRIIIKESKDYVAQTHKILKETTREIGNVSDTSISLDLDKGEEKYPPLFFEKNIISHHIVILTIDFKIKSFSDLFKKNLFQIEIPVDLDPKEEADINLTKLYQEKYFDNIRLLKKPYQDYQKYI
ncbi:unnamed protein product [Paramecium octaurelia]|uniref:Uncharacterized protein n=1 Tax=Paramecium octaurelia TaxID=43137 RepID=A0A8S1SN27_PAROT|nr:unnamed protein product [Paramecium octaurelia]